MLFNSIMHVTFITDDIEAMRDFYVDKLGGELKIVTRAIAYKGRNHGHWSELAETDPEKILLMYVEVAPNTFIELFPSEEGQAPHPESKVSQKGYSHFALLVDDIYKAREELEARGLVFDTEISKGPSETYQMWTHDPDGNEFEVMQFTDKSYQLVGHIM